MGADFVIEQDWGSYGEDEHETWRILFARQQDILRNRAAPEFLDGLKGLGIAADGIPDFERLSEVLDAATGWRIVAVPGLVPDDVFFGHLANRRFPATNFIRRRDKLDYLQEPTSSTTSTATCRCSSTRCSPIIFRPMAGAASRHSAWAA